MKTGSKIRNQPGFTIIELMIGIAVAGVLLGIAVPAFKDFQAKSSLKASAADFITSVNTARIQAVSLRVDVTLKPLSGSNWAAGWKVDYPNTVITETDQEFLPKGKTQLTSDDGLAEIRFRSNGLTNAGEAIFSLCDNRTGEEGRKITVSPFGKVTNEKKSCS